MLPVKGLGISMLHDEIMQWQSKLLLRTDDSLCCSAHNGRAEAEWQSPEGFKTTAQLPCGTT